MTRSRSDAIPSTNAVTTGGRAVVPPTREREAASPAMATAPSAGEPQFSFRALLDDQVEMVSIARPDGTLTYLNKSYARHYGQSVETMTGRSLFDFVNPRDRDLVRTKFSNICRTGQSRTSDNRTLHPDGRVRWVSWTNSLYLDATGDIFIHSVGRDVTERRLAESALEELTTIFVTTSDLIVQATAAGVVTYMNPAARRAFSIDERTSLAGTRYPDCLTCGDTAEFRRLILPAVEAAGSWVGVTTVRSNSGQSIPVSHMVIGHRSPDGPIERFSSIMRDISREVANQVERQRQTAVVDTVLESIPALIAVVGTDLRYRLVNRNLARWLNAEPERLVGQMLGLTMDDSEYRHYEPWFDRVLAGETVGFECQVTKRAQISDLAINLIPLRMEDGTTDGFVCVAQDITHHRQEAVRLRQLALRDPLTGLLNRSGVQQFADDLLGRQDGGPVACLCIDLDRFKPVNDVHGHLVGDAVLRSFAERLMSLVSADDGVARLGGDEFAVVLPRGAQQEVVESMARQIVEAASTPFVIDTLRLRIGASVGVAASGPDDSWRALYARADEMMYTAKRAGRGRHISDRRLSGDRRQVQPRQMTSPQPLAPSSPAAQAAPAAPAKPPKTDSDLAT